MEEKKQVNPHLENIADLLWLSQYTGMQSIVIEKKPDEVDEEIDTENYGNQKSPSPIPAKASISCQVSSEIANSRLSRRAF